MKRFLAIFAVTFLALSAPAMANCYSKAEAEAEQGIRIHSELMVIGLNCQNMKFKDGTNLYSKYSKFTADHENLFASYEDQLIGFFKKRGDKDPVASLNTLRTNFANKIALDSAKMRPDVFCNRYANRVFKVQGMDEKTLRHWASTSFTSHPVSQPVCH